MATNLLDKLITLAGSKLSGVRDYNDSSVYRSENSELTGVARYLNKFNKSKLTGVAQYLEKKQQLAKENEVVEASESGAAVSSVDKYLARKKAAVQAEPVADVAIEEPVSGVAKYLAGKGSTTPRQPTAKAAPAPVAETTAVPEVKKILSKVEKYLAKQSQGIKAAELPKVPEVKKILSKVEQYLAKQQTTSEKPKVKAAPAKPKSKVDQYLANHPEKSVKSSKPVKKASAKQTSSTSQRCQAATAKGTQCNRTANLSKIQRTINKKKYQFLACSQHKTDTFKPHPSFTK
jgi:hypothetical protein